MDNYNNSIVAEEQFYDEYGIKYSNLPLFYSLTKYITGNSMGSFDGNVPTPTGSCPFRGKSAAEKIAMCGVRFGMSSAEAMSTGNIIQYSMPGQSSSLMFNKNVINDLIAIQNEVNQLGWFTFKIGNCWRSGASAGGKSLHQIGCAVDINPGSAGNPWFETHDICTRGAGEAQQKKRDFHFTEGEQAPWGFHYEKGKPVCAGNTIFKRSTCIWSFDHPVVTIFRNHGWGWGGAYGDVMHFSLTGG